MKNCNMVLKERLQKYQHCHLCKSDNYEYLAGQEILPSGPSQLNKTSSPLGNGFEN